VVSGFQGWFQLTDDCIPECLCSIGFGGHGGGEVREVPERDEFGDRGRGGKTGL